MDDSQLIHALERKFDELLDALQRLERENKTLRGKESAWAVERAQLIQKNEIARSRVEAMITRLKALEQDS